MKRSRAALVVIGFSAGLSSLSAHAEIRIGITLPLTGYAASYGEDAKRGADLAADQVNAAGGIKGEQVQLVIEDDSGMGKTGITVTQKLLEIDKVPVIIGGIMSSVALPTAPLARANRTVYISTLSSHPDLTSPGGFIYRLAGSDALLGRIEAQFAIGVLKSKKAVGLFSETEYSATNADIVRSTFEGMGGQWLMSEEFKQGAVDFRTQLVKLKQEGADTLFITSTYKEAAPLFREMTEIGYHPHVMGTSFLNDMAIFSLAGDAANDVYFATSAAGSVASPSKVNEAFEAAFNAKFHKSPGIAAHYFFDATNLAMDAIKAVGPDGGAIDAWMAKVKGYAGVTSTISFNAQGDNSIPATVRQIRDGQFLDTGFSGTP